MTKMLNVMYFPAEKNGKKIGDGVVELKNKKHSMFRYIKVATLSKF